MDATNDIDTSIRSNESRCKIIYIARVIPPMRRRDSIWMREIDVHAVFNNRDFMYIKEIPYIRPKNVPIASAWIELLIRVIVFSNLYQANTEQRLIVIQ